MTVLAQSRWRQPYTWMLVGLTLLLLIVGTQYIAKSGEDRSAFNRWRNQVQGLIQGEDVYAKYNYPNAPIMGLILYPLSVLPRMTMGSVTIDLGAISWFILKIGMTVLTFHWVVRLVAAQGVAFPFWAQAVMLAFSLRPIVGDLSHGNVNLLIMFLVVGAVYAFRTRKDNLAGLTLALAITCKVTPALFVPYFLWKRAWKTLAATLVGLGLFFVVVPGSILGYAHTIKITRTWVERMILPFTMHGEVTTEHNNQSLPGLIYRLTTHSPSFLDDDDQPLPEGYYNWVNLAPDTARLMVKVCGAAFLLFLVLMGRTPTSDRAHPLLAAEYALVVLGMLLFSERTWKHHCVTLILPFGVICYHWAVGGLSVRLRSVLLGSCLLATLIMATTSTSLWETLAQYKMGAKLAQVYGAYVWAYFILLGSTTIILICSPWRMGHNQQSSRRAARFSPQPYPMSSQPLTKSATESTR